MPEMVKNNLTGELKPRYTVIDNVEHEYDPYEGKYKPKQDMANKMSGMANDVVNAGTSLYKSLMGSDNAKADE